MTLDALMPGIITIEHVGVWRARIVTLHIEQET